jgi:hypothetical protein
MRIKPGRDNEMILKNGMKVTRRVADSYGDCAYVMWVEDSYFPTPYFVRGDNISDAHDWFLCDPRVERSLALDAVDIASEFATPESQEHALNEGIVAFNDNGTLIWSSGSVGFGCLTVKDGN